VRSGVGIDLALVILRTTAIVSILVLRVSQKHFFNQKHNKYRLLATRQHGRRKDFSRVGPIVDFSRGSRKMFPGGVKNGEIAFSLTKPGKQLFLQKM